MQVQKLLRERGHGDDVLMVSITLDPEHDTPERLAEYAERYGAAEGWLFLTGDHEEIEDLRHRFGVYDPDPVIDADRTQHAGLVVYGNETLDRWAALPGEWQPELIVRAVLRLL